MRVCIYTVEEVEQRQRGCTDLQSSCRVGTVPYFDLLMDITSSSLLPPCKKKREKNENPGFCLPFRLDFLSLSSEMCCQAAFSATDYSLDSLSLSHSPCCFANIFHCLSFMLYLPPFSFGHFAPSDLRSVHFWRNTNSSQM